MLNETIPAVVTWQEVKDHLRLDDDNEKPYLMRLASAAIEAFEKETNIAVAERTVSVAIGSHEIKYGYYEIPKGPVKQITSVVGKNNATLGGTSYEVRTYGKRDCLYFFTCPQLPCVLTYVAGAAVPELVKQAVLLHVEHLYRNRGATGQQAQNVVEFGLERIYALYDCQKALIG